MNKSISFSYFLIFRKFRFVFFFI